MLKAIPADALPDELKDDQGNSEEQEETDPAGSQPGKEQEEETPSQQGDSTGEYSEPKDESEEEDDKTPFHKRWKKREEKLNSEWQTRFDAMQAELDGLKTNRSETPKKDDTETIDVPSWFLGDEEAYKSYLQDRKAERDELIKAVRESEKAEKEARKQELAEYESNYDNQLLSIEEGLKRDLSDNEKNRLLNFVVNELTEDERPLMSDGLYNLKAAYRMFVTQYPDTDVSKERKSVASKTVDGGSGEVNSSEPKVWSSKDFRIFNRR